MARKLILREEVEVAKSLSSSFISKITMVPYMDNCSYQINITTSNSTGTFVVEASDDYIQQTQDVKGNPGSWVALPLGGGLTPNPVANAANDTILIDLNQLPFNAVRVSYTSTIAGTGTADIWLLNKSMGA